MSRYLSLVFVLLAGSMLAKDMTVKRSRSYLRQGPASYYEVLMEIPTNSKVKVIKEGMEWLQVEYRKQRGYLSRTSTQAQKKPGDPFTNLQRPPMSANAQGVTAGVKGFCAKFNTDLKVSSSFPDLALSTGVNPRDYQEFYKQTFNKRKSSHFLKAYSLPERKFVDFYSEAAEGFGLSVASIIAAQGLYKNAPLATYVNKLGTVVASAADTPEIQYRFFLLDISQPNAYACPGGFIFISKGMLQLVENEAQLAFVLAHEIAHVSRFHGLKEIKLMENQIAAEDVFAEMERDLADRSSQKFADLSKDLESDIREMAATLTEGRLDTYEEEADAVALLLLARSGYNPKAGEELLTKLLNTRYESNNQHYRRQSVQERLKLIKTKTARLKNSRLHFISDHPRFTTHKAFLDSRQ